MKKFRWTAVLVSFCIFPQKFLLRKSSEVNCLRPRNDSRLKDILNSGRIYVDSRTLVMDYAACSSLDYQCKPLVSREGATPIPLCRIPTDEGGVLFKMCCREARPSSSIFVSEKLLHLPKERGTRAMEVAPCLNTVW